MDELNRKCKELRKVFGGNVLVNVLVTENGRIDIIRASRLDIDEDSDDGEHDEEGVQNYKTMRSESLHYVG